MRLGNLGLRTKFMSGGIFPMLLVLLLAVTGIMTLRAELKDLLEVERVGNTIRDAVSIDRDFMETQNSIYRYVLTGDNEALAAYKSGTARVEQGLANLNKAVGGATKAGRIG